MRLLTRTTRRVAPTEAGERLLRSLRPAIGDIETELASLTEFRERPAGTIRITSSQHAADTLLWPACAPLMRRYPEMNVEITVDHGLTDIVAERYDAGVRLGEQVAKDMVAARIGPDYRMAVVGSPAYFADNPAPRVPQDLVRHRCVNLRMSTSGGLYAWELEKGGRELKVRVEGQFTSNRSDLGLKAAVEGFGLVCTLDDLAAPYLADERLVRVLEDWCPPFPGYHLYYPSRRQPTPAFAMLVDALRHRG